MKIITLKNNQEYKKVLRMEKEILTLQGKIKSLNEEYLKQKKILNAE